jgi:hypothetical protein
MGGWNNHLQRAIKQLKTKPMELQGEIIKKYETKQVSDKFKSREVVIKTEGQYPQHILCQLTQDKCSLLDAYKVGDKVKASINLRGRGWQNKEGETKYFNAVEIWRFEAVAGEFDEPKGEPGSNQPSSDDGLPF